MEEKTKGFVCLEVPVVLRIIIILLSQILRSLFSCYTMLNPPEINWNLYEQKYAKNLKLWPFKSSLNFLPGGGRNSCICDSCSV